jgi:hypothetical protein
MTCFSKSRSVTCRPSVSPDLSYSMEAVMGGCTGDVKSAMFVGSRYEFVLATTYGDHVPSGRLRYLLSVHPAWAGCLASLLAASEKLYSRTPESHRSLVARRVLVETGGGRVTRRDMTQSRNGENSRNQSKDTGEAGGPWFFDTVSVKSGALRLVTYSNPIP